MPLIRFHVFPALLAFFAVARCLQPVSARAEQDQPPPDTRPARERHRVREMEVPPPEGPWGNEEFGVVWEKPVWRGLTLDVGVYGGDGLECNLPHGIAASSDGVNPPVFEKLEWHEERFRSMSFAAGADLDMFRLCMSYFHGTFDARGTFIRDNGVSVTNAPVDFAGTAYGLRFGGYWPALRLRDAVFEAAAGPAVYVGWLHEETQNVPPGLLLRRDAVDVLTGGLGPKASARLLLGRFELEANAEYSFMTGGVRGWVKEFSAGVGIHF